LFELVETGGGEGGRFGLGASFHVLFWDDDADTESANVDFDQPDVGCPKATGVSAVVVEVELTVAQPPFAAGASETAGVSEVDSLDQPPVLNPLPELVGGTTADGAMLG